MSDTSDRPILDVDSVFVVYRDPQNGWMATNDLTARYKPRRTATPDDMVEAAAIITQDIGVEKTASRMLAVMQQQAQAAMAAAHDRAVTGAMRTTDAGLVLP